MTTAIAHRPGYPPEPATYRDLHPADARIARREDDHFAAYHVTDAEYAEMLARALEALSWA